MPCSNARTNAEQLRKRDAGSMESARITAAATGFGISRATSFNGRGRSRALRM
jgi:hypothetical protein